MKDNVKSTLDVLSAHSLRELVETVNACNATATPILKEDIVSIMKESDTYFLFYYR